MPDRRVSATEVRGFPAVRWPDPPAGRRAVTRASWRYSKDLSVREAASAGRVLPGLRSTGCAGPRHEALRVAPLLSAARTLRSRQTEDGSTCGDWSSCTKVT